MADVAKTVSIIFQGEDKTSAALRSVESGLDGIGTEAAGATTKLGAVGDEVEEIGKKGASIDGLADAFQDIGGNARALVPDRELHHLAHIPETDGDDAFFLGELHRIGEKIDQYLLAGAGIGHHQHHGAGQIGLQHDLARRRL